MSSARTQSYSIFQCAGGELCTCSPFPCPRSTPVTSALSCRTLPHIPASIAGIEPEPSSASLFLHSHRNTQPSRKLSSPPPHSSRFLARAHIPRRASTKPQTSSSSSSTCWAADVLSVSHNALRSECAHLRTICASLRMRGHARVQDHEIDELAEWWLVFARFADTVLETEERVIVPWALARGGSKLRQEIDDARVAAFDAVAAVEATLDLRRHVDKSDLLAVFLVDAPVASARILEYCTALQAALLPHIRANRAPGEKPALDRKVISALRRGPEGAMRIALMAEWMQPALRDKWVKKHLRPVNRLLYPRWAKRYYRDHVVVPIAFQRRLDAHRGIHRDVKDLLAKKGIHSPPVTPEKVRPLFSHDHLDAYASTNSSPESRDEDVSRFLHF